MPNIIFDSIMFLFLLLLFWTIFFGAAVMYKFSEIAVIIAITFIGLVILEVITITEIIKTFEVD